MKKSYPQQFVYVTTNTTEAIEWANQLPYAVWVIRPDSDFIGLGALELAGWQFFLCSPEEILVAVESGLTQFLDARMRRPRCVR